MLRTLPLLMMVPALGCVPEDPPGFSRDQQPTRAETPRPRAAKTRGDAGRKGKSTAARPSAPGESPLLSTTFRDNFERGELGSDWKATSAVWRLENGALCGRGARNRPVWLTRRLPPNARIEFDATSNSPQGDLKVEVWGDGKSFATGTSYDNATSYIVVFGGWKNTAHVLARLDEHKSDRLELKVDPDSDDPRQHPVSEGQTYHFKIERSDGETVRWFIDDLELHSFVDPEPLSGSGHEHFAFNDWDVPVCFDNLVVVPLED
ncbi:MAG TPA: hypothetical protein VM686_37110 [Polyangiaceae bacterium]|nr:hypothetical protein [Polyangiaceae bacterium]